MIKVLMVGNDSSVKGGITSVINQLLQYNWKQNNIELEFIPTYVEKNNIMKIIFYISAYIKILMKFLVDKPQYVYMHMSYKGSFTRKYYIHKLCKIFGVKDIIHLHGSEFEKWYNMCSKNKKKGIRKLLRESSQFIVLGNEWEKKIKKIEPLCKIAVINNTVKIPEKPTIWNKDKFRILFLGVLIKRKGVDDLLDAINTISKEMDIKNVEFIIAGSGVEKERLEAKAKNLNLTKYVKFIGWVDDEQKRKLFLSVQLMVLPSYNEGLPISILEAISYGIPVISTEVGDIASAIINKYNGFLFEPGDVGKLAKKLKMFIKMDFKEWNKYSMNSRNIAENKFSDLNYFDRILNIYKGD